MKNKKNSKFKKYLSPIIVGIVLCLYYIGVGISVAMAEDLEIWVKVLCFVMPTILCCAIIGAMIQRIKEISDGEEDDANKY